MANAEDPRVSFEKLALYPGQLTVACQANRALDRVLRKGHCILPDPVVRVGLHAMSLGVSVPVFALWLDGASSYRKLPGWGAEVLVKGLGCLDDGLVSCRA